MEGLDSKNKANDYFMLARRNQRTELFTTVHGWDVANTDARRYLETLLAIRQQHMDTRLDRAGGTPDAPAGTRGRGVTSSGPINIQPHDYNEFLRQMQQRQRMAAGDGVGGRW